jgi:hypothetical protein
MYDSTVVLTFFSWKVGGGGGGRSKEGGCYKVRTGVGNLGGSVAGERARGEKERIIGRNHVHHLQPLSPSSPPLPLLTHHRRSTWEGVNRG